MNFSSKIRFKSASVWLLALLLFVSACQIGDKYPPEPIISFISYSYIDSLDAFGVTKTHLGLIVFSFTDGDGDIGLTDVDVNPPYDNNMYITRKIIVNSEEKIHEEMKFRIPYITPEGINKSLSGEIDVDILLPDTFTFDTMYYDIYILDRELHKSNVITSPYIVL